MLPHGHAPLLPSSRLLAGTFPLGAKQDLCARYCFLTLLNPLMTLQDWGCCARPLSRCHVCILPRCNPDKSRRTTRGQEEDKGRTGRGQQEEKRRTRGGKKKGKKIQKTYNKRTRWRRARGSARLEAEQEEDNRWTRRMTGGHRVHWRGQAGHQQKENKRTGNTTGQEDNRNET